MSGDTRPVGIFDSGVGGLSVLRQLRTRLPAEDFLYVADSAHAPYGRRSEAYVQERARHIAGFLVEQGVKAIVIACNTATAAAAALLRAELDLPIVAMEPAVKPAVAATRSGVVGVLATEGTLGSEAFAALLARHAQGVEVLSQPCPGLVECIEDGVIDGPRIRELVERYVTPLVSRGADTLILGCTHFPLASAVIQSVAGPGTVLIETGAAVARELERRLAAAGLLRPVSQPGQEWFWTSASPDRMLHVLQRLWTSAGTTRPLPLPLPAPVT